MYLGYIPRRSWSTEERCAAKVFFVEEINNGTTPSMDKCRLAIKNSQELNKRTPVQLKTWVQNYIKMKSRPQSSKVS